MAVLWMDGFDHYGVDEDNLLDGVYAERNANIAIDTVHVRTGTYSLRCATSVGTAGAVRRIFGAAKTTAGVGYAAWVDNLPVLNNKTYLMAFCDTGNNGQVAIILQSTGKVSAYRCTGTNVALAALLAESADGAVVAGAFQHIEAKVTVGDGTAGAVEVRVNGVTVVSASGVDTAATGNVETSQVRIHGTVDAATPPVQIHIDDLFAWDSTGAQNTDFLGDRRVRTFFPNADTAVADWSLVGAVAGYDCINEAAPDEDTTYLLAAPLTGSPVTHLRSEFGLEDAPATIGAIAAVQTYLRARKTEAGTASVRTSMVSGISASDGSLKAITEQYTYWTDMHELNPDTGTPWSQASFNAAKVRVAREE